MVRGRQISVAVLIALIGALPGCAGQSPFARFGFPATAKNPSHSQSVVKTDDPRINELNAALHKKPKKKTFSQYVSSAFKKSKPKVIKAPDPTDLNHRPEKINAEIYISGARMLEARGQAEVAEIQYLKALRVEPNNFEALIGLALLKEAGGDLTAAETHYRKALQVKSNDLTTSIRLARLKDRQGDFEEAIQVYRRTAQAHPKSPLPQNDMGLCYHRHGNIEASVTSLQRTVSLQPSNKQYRNNLSTVLVQIGEYSEALKHLKAAHGEASAHYNLGYLLHSRDKHQQAAEQFALALEKDPSLKAARKMLDRLKVDDRNNIAGKSGESDYRFDDKETQQVDRQDDQLSTRNLLKNAAGDNSPSRFEKPEVQRASQFRDGLLPEKTAADSNANYPVIRLPEVNGRDWQESDGPMPPTPVHFDVGAAQSLGSTRYLPPVD